MTPGEANQETSEKLKAEGYEYDSSNKAYYNVSQEGVKVLYAEDKGDRVCDRDSNNWRKLDDSK